MRFQIMGTLVLAGSLLTLACGSSRKAEQVAPAVAQSQTAVADGDFGVPECDQFMKKYLACIDAKVPDVARASMKQALDQTRTAWKQAAATPQGRASLAAACTQMEANTKQATQAYGCQW